MRGAGVAQQAGSGRIFWGASWNLVSDSVSSGILMLVVIVMVPKLAGRSKCEFPGRRLEVSCEAEAEVMLAVQVDFYCFLQCDW